MEVFARFFKGLWVSCCTNGAGESVIGRLLEVLRFEGYLPTIKSLALVVVCKAFMCHKLCGRTGKRSYCDVFCEAVAANGCYSKYSASVLLV